MCVSRVGWGGHRVYRIEVEQRGGVGGVRSFLLPRRVQLVRGEGRDVSDQYGREGKGGRGERGAPPTSLMLVERFMRRRVLSCRAFRGRVSCTGVPSELRTKERARARGYRRVRARQHLARGGADGGGAGQARLGIGPATWSSTDSSIETPFPMGICFPRRRVILRGDQTKELS